ncbi:MAG: hypothetical protein H7287_10450, partial [Thermoleophilia bacterium]|nr:hypothetical protein [Thermoleophilia bacterium]
MHAALLAGGDSAAIACIAAANVWQTSRFTAPHIDVVTRHRLASRSNTVFHQRRDLDPGDGCEVGGVRVTTFTQTLVDVGRVLTAHQVANVMYQGAFRSRLDVNDVRIECQRRAGRHGVNCTRRALALFGQGSAGT